jgi:hypothetical protein
MDTTQHTKLLTEAQAMFSIDGTESLCIGQGTRIGEGHLFSFGPRAVHGFFH